MTDDQVLKRNIRWAAMGFGCVIIVLIAIFFVNNALFFVGVSGAPNGSPAVSVADAATGKKIGGAGIVVVPRSTHTLLVSAGDTVRSLSDVSIPWFGIGAKTVQLTADSNADKAAYLSSGQPCAAYSATLASLLRYDCSTLSTLSAYQTPTDGSAWASKPVATLSYLDGQLLPPYKSGVIGIAAGASSEPTVDIDSAPVAIVASDATGAITYNAPVDVSSSSLAGMQIITDTSSASNNHFALVDPFGVVYLATVVADGKSVTYKRVSASGDYSARYNQTACTLRAETLYCLRSRTTVALDKGAKAAVPTVDTFSFSDGLTSSVKVTDAPIIDGIYSVGDTLYASHGKTLYALEKLANNYAVTHLYDNVASSIAGSHLYFISDNGVYQLNGSTHEAQQIFSSPNIGVTGIYPVDGKVFVFGKTRNGGDNIYAYQLNSSADTNNGKRLIDVLPFGANVVKGIASADLVGNEIAVTAASGTDATTAKTNFLGSLNGTGITVSSASVTVVK